LFVIAPQEIERKEKELQQTVERLEKELEQAKLQKSLIEMYKNTTPVGIVLPRGDSSEVSICSLFCFFNLSPFSEKKEDISLIEIEARCCEL